MNDLQRTLHIFYRHVHVKADKHSRDPNKSRPDWFTHERCFRNLLATIDGDARAADVIVTVMYDGPVDDLITDFIAPYVAGPSSRVKLQLIQAGSDTNSFRITASHANGLDLPATDLVYLLENDYLHTPGWVGKVFDLYASDVAFDVVSLYDHKDKYFLPMYRGLTAELQLSRSHHWRSAPSTCGSFLLTKAALQRDFDIYLSGKPDYYIFQDLVEGRKRILLTPIPGLSTHAMEGYTSPNVDWAALAA